MRDPPLLLQDVEVAQHLREAQEELVVLQTREKGVDQGQHRLVPGVQAREQPGGPFLLRGKAAGDQRGMAAEGGAVARQQQAQRQVCQAPQGPPVGQHRGGTAGQAGAGWLRQGV